VRKLAATKDNGRVSFRYVNKTHKLTFPRSGGNLHITRSAAALAW